MDLSTVFNACQEALNKAMIKQHSGSIINIGSVAAVCPDRTQVGYGVAKSGINHLSRQMARQVAHAGVRVNVLNPGIIATEAVAKHLTPETQSRYTTNCMIKHLGEPIDIAYMALYLASDESKYVTAHVMNVSGGWMSCPLCLLFISSHSSGKEPGVSRALFRSLPRKRTRTRRSRVRVFQGRKREFDLHNV
ncbi:MAG: SDR family NAD(P)-dependent oxidoreductase [Oscillospiraceae bacterium]